MPGILWFGLLEVALALTGLGLLLWDGWPRGWRLVPAVLLVLLYAVGLLLLATAPLDTGRPGPPRVVRCAPPHASAVPSGQVGIPGRATPVGSVQPLRCWRARLRA